MINFHQNEVPLDAVSENTCFVIYFPNTYGIIQPSRLSEVIYLQLTSHYTCLDFLLIIQRSRGLNSLILTQASHGSNLESMVRYRVLGSCINAGNGRKHRAAQTVCFHEIHNSASLDTRKRKSISLITVPLYSPLCAQTEERKGGEKKKLPPAS